MSKNIRFKSRVDLPEDARSALIDELNLQLATTLDLYTQVKQAHWNIKGPQFFARHELFDKLADRLRAYSDDIAERAGVLGGYASGTLRLSAEKSALPEYDLDAVDGRAHIVALADRYATYSAGVRKSIAKSQECKDPGTEDLFTEVLRGVELDLWFLESHLNS